MSELSETSVESRMLEIEQAARNNEAQGRLAEIRAELGLAPAAAEASPQVEQQAQPQPQPQPGSGA
jgi:hypothetical protein